MALHHRSFYYNNFLCIPLFHLQTCWNRCQKEIELIGTKFIVWNVVGAQQTMAPSPSDYCCRWVLIQTNVTKVTAAPTTCGVLWGTSWEMRMNRTVFWWLGWVWVGLCAADLVEPLKVSSWGMGPKLHLRHLEWFMGGGRTGRESGAASCGGQTGAWKQKL